MERESRRRVLPSPDDGQAFPPAKVARPLSDSEDEGPSTHAAPPPSVPGPSGEPDVHLCSSIVRKSSRLCCLLVGEMPADRDGGNVSTDDEGEDDNVDVPIQPNVSQEVSRTSGALYPSAPLPSQMPVFHGGAPSHSGEEFLGFPVQTATSYDFSAAFALDEANGDPVPEPLAQKLRPLLRMVPDDKRARLVADQWPIPSNVPELKVPESDANALSTLDPQQRRMETKLVHTNSLLGKALIPLIRFVAQHANSQDPSVLESYKDINASLSMLLPVFNYLNLMRRDLITDKLKAKSLQKTVKDKHMTGDKLFEANIVDMVKQFKENQRHINPRRFKAKRANQFPFRKGNRGSGTGNYRGTFRGRGGRGRGNFGNK